MNDAEKAIKLVKDAPLLAFDTETSGVDWRKNFPIGYIFCADPNEAIYIPIRAGGGGNLPGVTTPKTNSETIQIHPFEKDLAKAFKKRKGLTVGHHIKFDCHMAANVGVELGRNLSCTQNCQTLLNEYSYSFSLADCAKEHKVQAKKGDELYKHIAQIFGCPADRKAMARFWELPGNDPAAVDYAKGDGMTTYQLYLAQERKLAEQELFAICELESQLIWTLFRMERRGIAVDEKYLLELQDLIKDQLEDAQLKLPQGFNVRSPIQCKALFEANGKKDWPITAKGNPSFSEQWLKKSADGQRIVAVRKLSHLLNSFVGPLIEEHIYDGRVHATFNQLRADDHGTPARLSCSTPNLQQIPKRDKEIARLFRQAFIADDSYEFNEADWSQCEPRLYAHYSQEPSLIAGYLKDPPEDIYDVGKRLMGVDRQTAKTMTMGILNVMYPNTFAGHMDWPLDRATEAWNKWHNTFPKIREFQEMARKVLLERGYVKTILGRRLRLEAPRFAYRAVGKIIQGGNADILKYFLLKIDKLLENETDAQLLASVHDSIEWQSKKSKRGEELNKEILDMMVRVQEPPFSLRVPFQVDYKKGKSWADATFGKDD